MTTLYLRKTMGGFVPDTDEDFEASKRFKLGQVAKAEVTSPRNLSFFRKWWALVKVGFDLWEETGVHVEWKGEEIRPDFERFRKDVTILAGFGRPVVNLKGEIRYEAESIAFGKMGEDQFEKLYNATLATIVTKVMKGRISEQRLREMAQAVEEFA